MEKSTEIEDKSNIPFYSRSENSKDNWETPPYFFNRLNNIFGFTLDACASPTNKKCPRYFTEQDNGLAQEWVGERVFINPPFSQFNQWANKALEQSEKYDIIVVMIVPSRTDTAIWHEVIMKAKEIWFVRGRVNFLINGDKPKNGATFPLSVIVFQKHQEKNPIIKSFDRND